MPILYRPDRKPSAGSWLSKGQYDQQLPKALNEALCAVERIDADQHIGDVAGDADSFENQSISLDFRVCCKSQRYAPLLHLLAVKMHHAHRALADTDGANQNEQNAQPDAFQNHL